MRIVTENVFLIPMGPKLYCYRVQITRQQDFLNNINLICVRMYHKVGHEDDVFKNYLKKLDVAMTSIFFSKLLCRFIFQSAKNHALCIFVNGGAHY